MLAIRYLLLMISDLISLNDNLKGTQLSAFRGVGTLDVHISIAMGLFCDFNLAYEWVAMLDSIQSYPHVSTYLYVRILLVESCILVSN